VNGEAFYITNDIARALANVEPSTGPRVPGFRSGPTLTANSDPTFTNEGVMVRFLRERIEELHAELLTQMDDQYSAGYEMGHNHGYQDRCDEE
jgi:hypothetical protein